MKIYTLDKARGRSVIEVDGSLLVPTESMNKLGMFRLGEPLPPDTGSLDARVFFKDSSPYPLPEISASTFITPFSERAKNLVYIMDGVFASWIPLEFVGAGRVFKNLDWQPCSLEESTIDIASRYYALHINQCSPVLDVDKTLMSSEYILDPSIPPGNYLRIVFRQDIQMPPLFLLPGSTFGILATVQFFDIARKNKIRGVGRSELFNSSEPIENSLLPTTDKKHIVSLREAWELFHGLPKANI